MDGLEPELTTQTNETILKTERIFYGNNQLQK